MGPFGHVRTVPHSLVDPNAQRGSSINDVHTRTPISAMLRASPRAAVRMNARDESSEECKFETRVAFVNSNFRLLIPWLLVTTSSTLPSLLSTIQTSYILCGIPLNLIHHFYSIGIYSYSTNSSRHNFSR